jgi:hypothetical protein
MSRKLLPFVLVTFATAAGAADFEPKISLSVIRTDNLTLLPADTEAQTVYQLTPEFVVTQNSTRVDARAAYRGSVYRYDQRAENEVYNEFDGELVLSALPDRFFINMGADRTQSIIDPQSTIPVDNLAIVTNRVDRDDYYFGPSFQVPVGGNAVFGGDLRRTWVKYADEAATVGVFDNFVRDRGNLGVDNYRNGAGFTWALRYDYWHTDYGDAFIPYEYRQATVELGSWASQRTRLYVAGGQESPWDRPLDPALGDTFWEAGFVRQVGENVRAEIAYGERSFGPSRRVALSYNFGRGTTILNYNQRPATNAEDLFSRTGLVESGSLTDFLTRVGNIQRYVSELLQWEFNLGLDRTTLEISVFDESRVDLTDTAGTSLGDEQQSGATFSASWKIGVKTVFFIRGMAIRRDFATSDDSDFSSRSVGATYSLGRRTQLSLQLERREQTSEQFLAQNYEADLVSLTLGRSF